MNVEHRITNPDSIGKCRVSSIEYRASRPGFSLMEVLIAVGTLALGMLFIASVFPAGVYWTTVASERTISAVAAEDAFATIKLYGLRFTDPNWSGSGQTPLEAVSPISSYSYEYAYPSDGVNLNLKKYWWSAICQKIDTNDVQVTVFVSRKVGTGVKYPNTIDPNRPVAVPVLFSAVLPTSELTLSIPDRTLINGGSTIIDDQTGQIYRVLDRLDIATGGILKLDKQWRPDLLPQTINGKVWVIPPPVGGGRYPCIAVYQKVMRF
jgi:hypothetical protein